MTTLLGISGALRTGSFNTKLVHEAARLFAPDRFVMGDLNLPLYDGDVEDRDGIPASVQTLADQIAAADAVVMSTPEYNKGLSGVMKNALDWVSRVEGNPWAGKPVAILSATAGRAGGERAQYSLRHCMTAFRPRVLQGPEVLVGQCMREFDDSGRLTSDLYCAALTELMQDLRAEV
jgi:chromate reductase